MTEKIQLRNKSEMEFFGAPDSIITKTDPFLHVSNFSSTPVHIDQGRLFGWGHLPIDWLDSENKLDPVTYQRMKAHSQAIQSTVHDLLVHPTASSTDQEEVTAGELKGGPKTAEVPNPDPVSKSELLKEVNFSPDLIPEQKELLEEIVLKRHKAFGLDGRLGHYNAYVKIPLCPNAKEVSLPPFIASPEKRAVIDQQIDAWLSKEVIEPSKSPWGFPAFIVQRNKKPRMVIDYRKLNAMTIPDEFPLPRQEEILQSLTGAQWLSTLDALAGFIQLEIDEEDREKTAFRTHRGLFHFTRMPFGLRNGPSVFQRVTQSVLAPYLWLFTLVYIDDIVVFSLTFKDHIHHLDLVFKAIEKSGLTLSPAKCFLGYQSLLLLGQKVSRLGLSTHKEKTDAIVALKEPNTINELQTFHWNDGILLSINSILCLGSSTSIQSAQKGC